MLVELSTRYIFKNQIIIESVKMVRIFQKYSWIVQDAEINVFVFFLSTYTHHHFFFISANPLENVLQKLSTFPWIAIFADF